MPTKLYKEEMEQKETKIQNLKEKNKKLKKDVEELTILNRNLQRKHLDACFCLKSAGKEKEIKLRSSNFEIA